MTEETTLFQKFNGWHNYTAEHFRVNEWYYLQPLRKDGKVEGLDVYIHNSVKENMESQPDSFKISAISDDWWLYSLNFNQSKDWFRYSDDLQLIFESARNLIVETKEILPQLCLVDHFFWFQGSHGQGFSVYVSSEIRQWIQTNGSNMVENITKAMQDAYNCYPFQFSKREKKAISFSFRMWIHEDRFGISTHGDCACLGVDGSNYEEEQKFPHKLDPHNVDHVAQRFSLLCGIAEIWFLTKQSLLNKADMTRS